MTSALIGFKRVEAGRTVEDLKGFEKVIDCKPMGQCDVCYVKYKGKWFIVAFFQGKKKYAKVCRVEDVEPNLAKWGCNAIIYEPRGLYTFDDDLSKGIKKKMEMIIKTIPTHSS